MVNITDFLSQKTFREVEKAFRQSYDLPLEICDCQGNEVSTMCSKSCHPQFCQLVQKSRLGKTKCLHEKIRSINIAIETGQPYVSICHAGIVLICIPIMENDIPLGGLFLGKCLWEKPSDLMLADISARLKGVVADEKSILAAVKKLKLFSPRELFEISNFLFVRFYEMSNLDPQAIKWRNELSQQQSQIGEFIQEHKKNQTSSQYQYSYEQQLMSKVKVGDRIGTRDVLNCMLATIMLKNPGQLNVLKARLFELLSILSRSAVEGGADVNILLNKNLDYLQKLMTIENQQDLCAWTGKAIDEFTEMVYVYQDSKKTTQIKPAVDYIEKNSQKQIALSDVASAVHLSVSRLAHVFKEQMGITVIDYLTKVRIENAKQLLLFTDKNCTEICFEVGYNNQSYFTRTFKEATSLTPKQFKKMNQRR